MSIRISSASTTSTYNNKTFFFHRQNFITTNRNQFDKFKKRHLINGTCQIPIRRNAHILKPICSSSFPNTHNDNSIKKSNKHNIIIKDDIHEGNSSSSLKKIIKAMGKIMISGFILFITLFKTNPVYAISNPRNNSTSTMDTGIRLAVDINENSFNSSNRRDTAATKAKEEVVEYAPSNKKESEEESVDRAMRRGGALSPEQKLAIKRQKERKVVKLGKKINPLKPVVSNI